MPISTDSGADVGARKSARWQFWIDRGGTFTDIVARRPDGSLVTHKLLSDNPERYPDAALAGMRQLLGLPDDAQITSERVETVRIGTTVATNALLERRGEPTALFITRGFHDALRIAYQNRPRLFDLHILLPDLLYCHVTEVDERIGAQGDVVVPLDAERARRDLQTAHDRGIRSVAIVLMHGYRYPVHELALEDLAHNIGFTQVSVSHKVSPLMKLVARGDTTVADAYLSPVLRRYMDSLAEALPGVRLQCMQSSGGLTDARQFHGKDAILSGPAGGIVGMARTASSAGFNKVIGFDMGGTSTDVSHFAATRDRTGDTFQGEAGTADQDAHDARDILDTQADQYERVFETQVAGVRIRAPMLAIHTVAAGGGSALHFDGARYRVGPDSAGADPGPACYRRGGPPTITDCNVVLGKIQPAHFPAVFGPRGDQTLDRDAALRAFDGLADEIERATGKRSTIEQIAEGFIEIAVANMANAIKQISVQRGHDVAEYALVTFGGAGGQHACMVADALGMRTVFAHPLAGVLSAYGMGLAEQSVMREHSVEEELNAATLPSVQAALDALAVEAECALHAQGIGTAKIDTFRHVHLRYVGTDTALAVCFGSIARMTEEFEAVYRQRFSFLMRDKVLMVESISVQAIARNPIPDERLAAPTSRTDVLLPDETVHLYSGGGWHATGLFRRESLRPGDRIDGPAIVAEENATTVIEPGWQAEVTVMNHLVLRRCADRAVSLPHSLAGEATDADPVRLELFNNLFMSIAEQMGLSLQNTAHSVNIKERLDFSCAMFDGNGHLIANAPHMPVHLGSMGESIRTVITRNTGAMQPGDVYALNDPYNGGTHLPDVTVITPVYIDAASVDVSTHAAAQASAAADSATFTSTPASSPCPAFYVASRGHHADIGGMTPGSMPPDSTILEEEGVLIDNWKLAEAGQLRDAATRALLQSGRYPVRNVEQNMADLRAQIAANQKGVGELRALVAHHGYDVVRAYMRHVQDNAEAAVRRAIDALHDGRFEVRFDHGAVIRVSVQVDRAARAATIDFTGTSAQLSNNFNAPRSVCMAAVLYVFRTLVDDDIPLNAGCLKPLQVVIPPGSMLDPVYPAAVTSGNVETSSAIVNALLGALGVAASSQSTMNNLTFGNDTHQYYETIAGGSGACPGHHGTDVVQTHMTNSRLTDPEVLEWRFPVRLERYAIRADSGGAGRWHGGNGGVREIRFLERMTVAILSNNRIHPPFGLAGGAPGAQGHNTVVRADGGIIELGPVGWCAVHPGDRIVIETPGGGGYGAVQDEV